MIFFGNFTTGRSEMQAPSQEWFSLVPATVGWAWSTANLETEFFTSQILEVLHIERQVDKLYFVGAGTRPGNGVSGAELCPTLFVAPKALRWTTCQRCQLTIS